ncbi:MAG TPA: alpha/beta hydrolase [Pseudomonas sp.]|jgi:pimeloyl-ACP methyl ester carboxylesterase|uniref:Alpha/beta hydrolase n=1 Tax=Halopseudomonas pachastrellae TaxID=254161 RepID=A0A1S8DFW7_9GAMM|nr:alpha/beta fold hydrolase [Halopseudomonas pachastrellae]MAP29453.1 alpha/beta hydrolase [Pseudomonas sp.]MAQ51482.1 alpha/beta hydrolase [Pseudomonas sp.]ONM43871.1 alpha/beta hydrolase [Halopseudomonas pachastrellae]WVM89007.1 alpha/beta fold hydrolase [Halopseudomonas pachastrellae]SFM60185.1 Pimeloyl-ACP methyl ester carboxylesterase [Halopseudomonas pachastrellae]|tara:strand:+ start:2446 stop:3309 length:864 start_codon:yes stop_codon:yes gene_type:complete
MPLTSHEVRFSLPHIEVAGKAWGEPGGLPVIALHGWLDNAATFDRVAPALEGVHLVALDLPGHGLSGHMPATGYSLWQQAASVLQVAEDLGWERFALLGHSMGAIISGILAGSLPERIIGAAMIDGLMPFTSEADDAPRQMARFFKSSLQLGSKRKPIYDSADKAISARVLGGTTPISREAAGCLVERGLMPHDGGWTWRTDPQLMLPSPLRLTQRHAVSFIENISAPACLVLANQGVMHKHPEVLDRIDAFEHLQVHRIDGGHHLHLEAQAPEVAAILKDFYTSLS